MRVAEAARFELVIGLRRPDAPTPDPDVLHAQGLDLRQALTPNPQDDLADFACFASRARSKARDRPQRQPDSRAARFSS